MSFADGLLHERQDRDGKTADKVDDLIVALASRKVTAKDIQEAIKYLKEYRDGRHLI